MISAWFVSDIHLKDPNERNGILFLGFLRSLQRRGHLPTHLFLLGDIFDLWVGNHDFYYRKFREIVDEIINLKRMGVDVHYFEGNHDLHIEEFWYDRFKIPCYVAPHYFQLENFVLRCEHGDFINQKDRAYLKLREILRSPRIEKLAQTLPGEAVSFIGEFASSLSRKGSFQLRRDTAEEMKAMIREYAQTSYVEKSFDLMVTGHMHVRDDWRTEINERKLRSINLGSWFDEPQVVHLTQNSPEWIKVRSLI